MAEAHAISANELHVSVSGAVVQGKTHLIIMLYSAHCVMNFGIFEIRSCLNDLALSPYIISPAMFCFFL